ncbi:hypothetical protein AGOR_G00163200 [Albula goreensis]|uniref:Sema domain-containing protein n=1 Tax=Albula goreensis TaxID=1534307 RepID=A0A8T3D0L1_9TELE|nr:hypothetical protein AGOR_G00163200 [Albula goreensis]
MTLEFKQILPLLWTLQLTFGLLDFTPRLIIGADDVDSRRLRYGKFQEHTVLFHPEGSEDLFVGGKNILYRIDLEHSRFVENFSLTPTSGQNCHEMPCENVVTVIVEFQETLLVCGTNAHMPLCWKVYPQVANQSSRVVKAHEGIGISPPLYTQNAVSLTVEGDLYAATPLSRDGTSLQFRRKAGQRPNIWMYDRWLTDPTFVSASWIRRPKDPNQEKIYLFFREQNPDPNPEADPWISRIARVCKVDEGGSKRFFQSMWTSFLKARLVCGFPGESLYFNRLQDVFVQHADPWQQSRVYGLFTSSWNATAVCVYSIEDIDRIFENSPFRGFAGQIPKPRPGACIMKSRDIPLDTLKILQEHPEMSVWIRPLLRHAPLYTSSSNYISITVDTVTAADGRPHNVMFLVTDKGTIHKILEDDLTPFIISEIHLRNRPAPVQSVKLLSSKGKLLVGFPDQVAQLDLRSCRGYGVTCADCILARDPYCAWTGSSCSPVVPGAIQNVVGGTVDVCHLSGADQHRYRPPLPDPIPVTYSLPLGAAIYLSCPVHSRHASYTWEHPLGRSSSCRPAQTQPDCLHLIPALNEEHYGIYQCISTERNFTQILKLYQLHRSEVERSRASPSATASQHAFIVLLVEVALVSTLWH